MAVMRLRQAGGGWITQGLMGLVKEDLGLYSKGNRKNFHRE